MAWMLVIERFSAVIDGLMVPRAMPDRPADALWPTAEEKAAAVLILSKVMPRTHARERRKADTTDRRRFQ